MQKTGNETYDWVIVGGGVAGCYLAHQLSKSGARVAVVEKSRGLGGRLCSRRTPFGVFLHGAPFFTIKSQLFRHALQPFLDNGDIVRWPGGVGYIDASKKVCPPNDTPRYSLYPETSLFCRHWTTNVDVFLQQKVMRLQRNEHWLIHTEKGLVLPAKHLVMATPLPQAQQLLPMSLQIEFGFL